MMDKIIQKSDLPELTGKESLFEMAEEVRKMLIEEATENEPTGTGLFWEVLKTQSDAKWWIDNMYNINLKYSIPELQGNEKQVKWANTIRHNVLEMMSRKKRKVDFWNWVREKTEAKWWIENREEMSNTHNFLLLVKADNIPKPAEPEILVGHQWNRKIYGKEGNHSVYLDGNKVEITDEQAKELEQYLLARTEYGDKVNEINKKIV
jgi:hypothetical protein